MLRKIPCENYERVRRDVPGGGLRMVERRSKGGLACRLLERTRGLQA